MKFDPWNWHKIRSDNIFPVFPGRVLGLRYAPFEALKRKKFVMATHPKPFDGIP